MVEGDRLALLRKSLLLIGLLVALAGCGQVPTPTPSSVATPTSVLSVPASPSPQALKLGDLAARVNAAWTGVESYRITFTGPAVSPAPLASPVASPAATPAATPVARADAGVVSVREVVLPDRQRQVLSGLGADDHEAIAVGGTVFVRGPLTARIAPGTPAEVWVAIAAAAIPDRSQLSALLGGLPSLPTSPLAAIPERLWPQALRDLGSTELDGRSCAIYGAADTTVETGTRVDYAIAVDERSLPCFIETSVGGVSLGRNEYSAIDASFTITAPVATPVAMPPALATPAAQD
jgi:hypothetical protein